MSVDNSKNIPDDLISVAYISGAFGVRGMVKLRTYNEQSPILEIKNWWLCKEDPNGEPVGPVRNAELVNSKEHSGDVVAQFAFSNDRDIAESLKGTTVWVSRADFPSEDEDEFYWVDIEGCDVYTHVDGAEVYFGVVQKLSDNGAHGILHVDRYAATPDDAGDFQPITDKKGRNTQSLIPFVKAHVTQVDLPAKKLIVDWPLDI